MKKKTQLHEVRQLQKIAGIISEYEVYYDKNNKPAYDPKLIYGKVQGDNFWVNGENQRVDPKNDPNLNNKPKEEYVLKSWEEFMRNPLVQKYESELRNAWHLYNHSGWDASVGDRGPFILRSYM